MRYSVVNLGCKVNRAESDDYEATLACAGYEAAEVESADVVIVNTCTVTGVAEKKTRKAVRQVLRNAPAAKVVVTGCASAIAPEVFAEMGERVCIVPKADMTAYLARMIEGDETREGLACAAPHARMRKGLKVQDGCDNACTYCIVHVARGRAVSLPIDEVLRGAQALMENGVQEIVLAGINIGSYSYEGIDLAGMLERLLELARAHEAKTGMSIRFRVSSVEPNDVSDSFIELLARSSGAICRHLHLPLQAGSSKVLREMARPYDAEDYRFLIDKIRAEVPEISLSTDVICGFPGETDAQFEETLELVRYCAFSKVHVFPYSVREGTPAAARTDQVPPHVRFERADKLRALSDELRAADFAARQGTEEFVLVESNDQAMTESYHEVPAPTGAAVGSLVRVVL